MSSDKTVLSGPTGLDLRGRQSVRATFKLSRRAITSLSLVAVHLGIKQKSLFDHLLEDIAALNELADEVRIRQFNKIERVQKTYVLSRKTLDVLDLISKDHDTPRDALVEYSIKRLESVILAEKSKHEKRKALFSDFQHYVESGRAILDRALKTLGPQDPFCISVDKAVNMNLRANDEIREFIEKSKIIEEF